MFLTCCLMSLADHHILTDVKTSPIRPKRSSPPNLRSQLLTRLPRLPRALATRLQEPFNLVRLLITELNLLLIDYRGWQKHRPEDLRLHQRQARRERLRRTSWGVFESRSNLCKRDRWGWYWEGQGIGKLYVRTLSFLLRYLFLARIEHVLEDAFHPSTIARTLSFNMPIESKQRCEKANADWGTDRLALNDYDLVIPSATIFFCLSGAVPFLGGPQGNNWGSLTIHSQGIDGSCSDEINVEETAARYYLISTVIRC